MALHALFFSSLKWLQGKKNITNILTLDGIVFIFNRYLEVCHFGRRDPPPSHMIVKRFGCTAVHNKTLYKCIIHFERHITFLSNIESRMTFLVFKGVIHLKYCHHFLVFVWFQKKKVFALHFSLKCKWIGTWASKDQKLQKSRAGFTISTDQFQSIFILMIMNQY